MQNMTKGRCDVSVTHQDGRVQVGYGITADTTGDKNFSDEAAMLACLLWMMPTEYRDLACYELGKELVH